MDRNTDGMLVIGLICLILLVTSVGPCKEITSREEPAPAAATEEVAPEPLVIIEPESEVQHPLTVAVLRDSALEPLAKSTSTRLRAAVVDLGDGRLLVAGGLDHLGSRTSESWLVPSSGVAVPTGALNEARAGAQALRTALGWTVVVGGGDEEAASAELYDSEHGTWSPGGRLIARSGYTLAPLPDGKVLAAGGADLTDVPLADVQLLDTNLGQWLPADPLSNARRDAAAVVLGDGRALLTGGTGADGMARADSELRSTDGKWAPGPTMTIARTGHAAVRLSDGRVLIVGGGTAELFDPETNRFVSTGAAPELEHGAVLFALPDGGALAAAIATEGCQTAAIAQWSPATKGWTSRGAYPCGATTVLSPAGSLYAIGGAPSAQ